MPAGRPVGQGRTDTAENVAREMLITGTPDYWIDVCTRAIGYHTRTIHRNAQKGMKTEQRTYELIKMYRDVLDQLLIQSSPHYREETP